MKNSVDWKLVRRDVKGLDWNESIRSSCQVSSLNEDRVPKRTIVVRTDDKPWFNDQCVLSHREQQRASRVWSCSRTQADWEKHRVIRSYAQLVYVDFASLSD